MSIEYGLSLTSTIALLADLGIPIPDEATPPEYPVRYKAGDGSIVRDGFPFVLWKWNTLSRVSFWRLMAYVGAGYVRTKTLETAVPSWADFACVVEPPDVSGQDATPAPQEVDAFTNVTLRISHLVAA